MIVYIVVAYLYGGYFISPMPERQFATFNACMAEANIQQTRVTDNSAKYGCVATYRNHPHGAVIR